MFFIRLALAGSTLPENAQIVADSDTILFPGTPQESDLNVEDIDFRRGDNNAGRIEILLSDPAIPIDVHEQGTMLIVDIMGTDIDDAFIKAS